MTRRGRSRVEKRVGIAFIGVTLAALLVGGVANGTTAEPALAAGQQLTVAVDLPDEPAPVIGDGITAAEMRDLQTIAEQTGESLEKTVARVGWQQDFAMLVTALREQYPAEIAGARIDPDGRPWIAFRGSVPASAVDQVARYEHKVFGGGEGGAAFAVELRGDAGFAEVDLEEDVVQAHYAALNHEGVANAASGYDVATGTILVQVEPSSAEADGLADSVRSQITKAGADGSRISVEVIKDVEQTEDAIWGGANMTTCTSGFSVTKNGTTDGISTAGHCSNSQSLQGSTLTFQAAHEGNWGDVQWHTSTTTEADDFYGGSTSTNLTDLRDVAARGNAVEGQSVCRNGKTTFKKCDTVYQLNHCSGDICHLTATQTDTGEGGDSGGPIYFGNTAYGIHRGSKYWFGSRDTFMPQQYFDNAIAGLVVATS